MPPKPASPYAEFLAELDEIQRHKWHLSERDGVDVGFERALSDWASPLPTPLLSGSVAWSLLAAGWLRFRVA
jgi:hypothetical protein